MSRTIGRMTWDACQSCKHTDELLGGCVLDVPESFDMMTLNYDSIECDKYEDVQAHPNPVSPVRRSQRYEKNFQMAHEERLS